MPLLDSILSGFRRRRVAPTKSVGAPGTAIYGGYVVENEKSPDLSDSRRFLTFSEILANTPIVAAGTRYFVNLCAKASWGFNPSKEDRDGRYAELAEGILTDDPATSWSRIVRRAAMYRFYGFSVQEWVARRREDGVMTLRDVAPRPQLTIERWDVEDDGTVRGIVQVSPQTQEEIYLPRERVVYLVDDTLNDSPQGLGLFRHLISSSHRLSRYEQLEGFGYETDLRGIPVGRAPYAELRRAVKDGEITEVEAQNAVAAIERFVERHVKRPDLGLLIDSAVYESLDAEGTPSSAKQFDLSLLQGNSTSQPEIAKAIDRINKEMARVLGVESILLGDGDRGSQALARDKTQQFSLSVEATMGEIAEGFAKDLLERVWQLNGWPAETMPELQPEAVQYRDIEQMAVALRDLAAAGAPLLPNDPAVVEMRSLMGLSSPDPVDLEMDASMRPTEGEQPSRDPAEGSVNDPENETPTDPAASEEPTE